MTDVEAGANEDNGAGRHSERRRLAFRGAAKSLWRGSVELTLAERLAELTAHAAGVTDLDQAGDVYGDGVVGELEDRVADLLGKDEAAFFPTGTMAQQAALRCWAGRTGSEVVAMHPLGHPEVHEAQALSVLTGLRTVHPTAERRLPTAEEVRDTAEPFGTLMLELPLRDAGFVLPQWDELVAVTQAARERDAVVHFDGARLWECTEHFGRPLEEIAELADSVYVSFYKSLNGLSGAVLAGPPDFVEEARVWRHRYGGQVFQQYPAALGALIGLERELPRLPQYVAHAKVVAAALHEGFAAAGVRWFRVQPAQPHTHEFQVWLPYEPQALTEAGVRLAEETSTVLFRRWFSDVVPGMSHTEVTVGAAALEWSRQDVLAAVEGFMARLG
ncbi:threonine aldolase family protein [Streptomyces sp. NPDC006879]|uniref:threonine aldolase family protein n=1 Tax=Streptomyces sp. NPDC006879 TaxID=3364767 RepID=UPI0036991E63